MSAQDGTLARAIALLERLVSFDSESANSNLPIAAMVEDYLASLGVAVARAPNATGDKVALFATIGPQCSGGAALSAHLDVVPVAGQSWSSDPFILRRKGDRLYGRGSCDMKGFIALCLAMVPEFQSMTLKRPIHLLLSYDEETTCMGPVDMIGRLGVDLPHPGFVIVGEPTLMEVADAHKAIAVHRTRILGAEAHSSKPALGADAIAAACDLVSMLGRLQARLEEEGDPSGRFDPPYSTVQVGWIQGGIARNIIARECVFDWEFRALPHEAPDRALRALEDYATREALARLRRFTPRASIVTETEAEVPGLSPQPGSLAEAMVFAAAQRNRAIAVPYATEAGRFQAAGLPTVVCGPGSIDQAHQPDEFIAISQLEAGLGFLRRLGRSLT